MVRILAAALICVVMADPSGLLATPARPGLRIRLADGSEGVVVGDERGYRIESDGVCRAEHGPGSTRPMSYSRVPVHVTGTALVYLIGVQFSDLSATESLSAVTARVSDELRSYYHEASRGLLDLEVTLLTDQWVTAQHPHEFYGCDGPGIDDCQQPIYELAREILVAVDAVVDYQSLDADHNGTLEMGEAHVIIVQAGADQASSGAESDIWSHRWWIYGPQVGGAETRLDGVLLSDPNQPGSESTAGYLMVSATDPLGVIAHELLHSFGAPDLYDVSGSGTVPVGPWSLMDIGLWLGSPSGSMPCRPGGYIEWDVDADADSGISGWVTPTYLSDGEHFISWLGGGTAEVMVIPTSIPTEYFLVENRVQQGIDMALAEAGLLIYHIDTAEPVNNTESYPPYRVWLEDPGRRALKRGAAYSEDDGPDQAAFTPATSPSSDSNRGDSTGIALVAIGPEGATMSFQLSGTVPVVQTDRLTACPVPTAAGGTLSVLLPQGQNAAGLLELWDLNGRKLVSRTLPAGTTRPLLTVPARPHAGALVLVYRTDETIHSAPIIIAP